jgi:hypothetical protein
VHAAVSRVEILLTECFFNLQSPTVGSPSLLANDTLGWESNTLAYLRQSINCGMYKKRVVV